jgi:hypothetical protein
MSRKHDDGLVTYLVCAVIVVATLCTIIADGGWMIWLPVLPALAVTAKLHGILRRR